MKRIIAILLCLALIAGMTTAVSAVSTDVAAAGDNKVYLNLYTDPNAEYPIISAESIKGEPPARPADPGKENEVFIDWYTDKAYHFRFDFNAPLYEDVDLYARFAPPEDVIGVNVFASPSSDYPMYGYLLVKGDLISYPQEPEVEEDHTLIGWYSDRALTKMVDFSQPVYDYLYLFPRIVPLSDLCYGDLYLDVNALEPVYSIVVVKGELCPVPAEPGKDGMAFAGWYTDRNLTAPMDFNQPCTEDFELFPKWEEICNHPHLFDNVVEGYAATNTADGMKSYCVCPKCGKWFYATPTALIEVDDPEDLIIPAKGPFLLGDADGNGAVESIDVTVIQRKLAGINLTGSFCRGAADVDSDDEVTIIDATFIQRHLAQMTTPYLIGVQCIPILNPH